MSTGRSDRVMEVGWGQPEWRGDQRENQEGPQRWSLVGINEIVSPGRTRHTHSNFDPTEAQEVSG